MAARHQRTGSGYAALRKQIEELLVIQPEDKVEVRHSFQDILSKWEKLREEAVPMSAATLKKHRGNTHQ